MGDPPSLASNVFELTLYGIGAITLAHAFRRSRWDGLLVGTAMVCGFWLEWADMRTSHMYYYGDFHWMLGSPKADAVPACIAVAWGCIVYSVMQATAQLPLSNAQRPLVCAFLALVLDLVLDPVSANSKLTTDLFGVCTGPGFEAGDAPGMHFWTWCVAKSYNPFLWYGIPLGNFTGWMAAVFGFTTAIGFVERRWPTRELGLAKQFGCLAALVALGGVITYGLLGTTAVLGLGLGMPEWLIFAIAVGIPLTVTLQMVPRVHRRATPELLPFVMPLFTFGFATWAMLFADAPLLKQAQFGWALGSVSLVGLYLYCLPYSLGRATEVRPSARGA